MRLCETGEADGGLGFGDLCSIPSNANMLLACQDTANNRAELVSQQLPFVNVVNLSISCLGVS